MNCAVTRQKDLNTSLWSGGKTTQLFLYPPGSSYAARDFEIRISSATVDDNGSVFTDLPGYHRLLMPLNHSMHLVYEGRGEVTMEPFQVEEFEGEWHTTSYGKCTDIGVMLAEGWQGQMKAVGKGTYNGKPGFIALYALADHVKVRCEENGESCEETLSQGDFFLVESQEAPKLVIEAQVPKAAVLFRLFRG